MKKIIYPKIGGVDSIEIIEAEEPMASEGEVVVRIHRAGINFADLMMRQGLYGSNPDFPFTCNVVFKVSIGIKNILHNPAVKEAHNVLKNTGKFLVFSLLSK